MAILSPAGVEERGTLLRELESTLLIPRCYSQDAPSLSKIGSQEYILSISAGNNDNMVSSGDRRPMNYIGTFLLSRQRISINAPDALSN